MLHTQKEFVKISKQQKLAKYSDLYVQSDKLLLAGVWEFLKYVFWNIWTWSWKTSWAPRPGLAWKGAFKKTKIKIDFLTNISMLLMVQKGISSGMCHSIYQYAKANSKYVKDYKENKEVSYLHYWDVNNLYGLLMSEKLRVNNFEWIVDTSQFDEDFIKSYIEDGDKG